MVRHNLIRGIRQAFFISKKTCPSNPSVSSFPLLEGIFENQPVSPFIVNLQKFSSTSKSPIIRGTDGYILPHGGKLVDRLVTEKTKKEELLESCEGNFLDLSDRNACDVELLVNGGFSPLEGFMNKEVYDNVVEHMRIPESSLLFGLPVVLDCPPRSFPEGSRVALQYKGEAIGVMEVESEWKPDKTKEAKLCYGTTSLEHPGVHMISLQRHSHYLSGPLWGLSLPPRPFPCLSPSSLRLSLPPSSSIVAFQCRNPLHKAHWELCKRALEAENVGEDAVVLVHPTCGPTQSDDIPGTVRFRTYEVLKEELNNERVRWAYLPYSMHMAGPREAIQHMIIRKNYGCTHFIIGRDMAGCKNFSGEDFYGPYDAQDFAKEHAKELGMETVPSLNVVYTKEEGYLTADIAKEKGLSPLKLSGTEFRKRLRSGEEIPDWFAFKSVVDVLREEVQSSS